MFNEVIFVKTITRFADLCWEGLTLQHISDKRIVIPYLLFIAMTLLFELFLLVLIGITSFIFYIHGYQPSLGYIVSGPAVLCMFLLTIPILKAVLKQRKIAY